MYLNINDNFSEQIINDTSVEWQAKKRNFTKNKNFKFCPKV